MFKSLSNAASLFGELQQVQGRVKELEEKLGRVQVEGRAGGEMVVVKADGAQRIVGVKIAPSLLQAGDAEMLEDLVVSATNSALDKAREAAGKEMSSITSGLELPGLAKMMSKFGFEATQPPTP